MTPQALGTKFKIVALKSYFADSDARLYIVARSLGQVVVSSLL